MEGGGHVLYLGEDARVVDVPDYAERLPGAIRAFTRAGVYGERGADEHRSFTQGGGNGGSHPHLAHHLLMAVLGEEPAYPDAVRAANITCAGILSHASAMEGGRLQPLPEWTMDSTEPFTIPLSQDVRPPWSEGSR